MNNPFDYINRKRKQQEQQEEEIRRREEEIRDKERVHAEEEASRRKDLRRKAISKYGDMIVKVLRQLLQATFPGEKIGIASPDPYVYPRGSPYVTPQGLRWKIYESVPPRSGDPWTGAGATDGGSDDKVVVELVLDSNDHPIKFIVTRYNFDVKTLCGYRRVESKAMEAGLSQGELIDALRKLFPPV